MFPEEVREDISRLAKEARSAVAEPVAAPRRAQLQDACGCLNLNCDVSQLSRKMLQTAFQREALVSHPDHGGDRQLFQLVYESYTLLRDHIR